MYKISVLFNTPFSPSYSSHLVRNRQGINISSFAVRGSDSKPVKESFSVEETQKTPTGRSPVRSSLFVKKRKKRGKSPCSPYSRTRRPCFHC